MLHDQDRQRPWSIQGFVTYEHNDSENYLCSLARKKEMDKTFFLKQGDMVRFYNRGLFKPLWQTWQMNEYGDIRVTAHVISGSNHNWDGDFLCIWAQHLLRQISIACHGTYMSFYVLLTRRSITFSTMFRLFVRRSRKFHKQVDAFRKCAITKG